MDLVSATAPLPIREQLWTVNELTRSLLLASTPRYRRGPIAARSR
jgi:hypothetical protein